MALTRPSKLISSDISGSFNKSAVSASFAQSSAVTASLRSHVLTSALSGSTTIISGSVKSTGSFGSIYTDKNVNASAFVGDGSSLTGIDIPTAAAISGSFISKADKSAISGSIVGGVSGSALSTGSFGRVEVAGNLSVLGKGGNLFQVVTDVDSTQTSTNSNSFAAKANPSSSITTTVLNSRIFLIGSTFVSNAGGDRCLVDFVRDVSGGATTTGISGEDRGVCNHQPTDADGGQHPIVFLDSPTVAAGTTITYQFCFKNGDNASTQYLGHDDVASTLTLMEIV
jgi:hypothetical protein